ncbi:MAG: XRE family transcriptional regulator, partial [Acidimicrobiia bacterium]
LLDIAAHLGFRVEAVDDMVSGLRSVTDTRTGRIYIAQRNELRTRQARKAILQTLAGRLLGHTEAADTEEFLRQRVETAYLAGAILVPEGAAVGRLRTAMEGRDLSIEDLKELFYVSYEMAAWRFVNLATRHLAIPSHLLVAGEDGLVVKGFANDALPFTTDPAGGVEAQPVCRRWGAAAVFDSPDKFDVHAQYTDTPAGTYFCVTHMEPDRPFSVTVGVPFRSAQWFRDRDTERRAQSRCPDPACCLLPTPDQTTIWEGKLEVSVRTQNRLLGRLASDPYPNIRDRRVYDLVERHKSVG